MLYISFNYTELHRLKEAVFAPHMVNAGQYLKIDSDSLAAVARVSNTCRVLDEDELAYSMGVEFLTLHLDPVTGVFVSFVA